MSSSPITGNGVGDDISAAGALLVSAWSSTGTFFDTDLLLANPQTVEAPVTIEFLRGDGITVRQQRTLAPLSRTTVRLDDVPGLESAAMSTRVTSTDHVAIVVERTMRWDASGYGAHTEKATAGATDRRRTLRLQQREWRDVGGRHECDRQAAAASALSPFRPLLRLGRYGTIRVIWTCGCIDSGRPAAGTSLPARKTSRLFRSTRPDAFGSFGMRDLPKTVELRT